MFTASIPSVQDREGESVSHGGQDEIICITFSFKGGCWVMGQVLT